MKLDLNILKAKVLPITLLDGTTVNIKKPSKLFLNEIEDFRTQENKGLTFKDVAVKAEEMTLKILNNNGEGRIFDSVYLEEQEIDYIIQTQIFKSYFDFIFELMTNPN